MRFKKLFLILIILIAGFLRFYKLRELPPGFHVDEVSFGYNAYSLMRIGKDENGNFFPLYIDTFGDQRPAGYFYLTIPAIKIFGLNEFAVRFPSAFFGVLAVWLVYFLVNKLIENFSAAYYISIIASFLLAISPWHITISRATSEASVALFLILAGVYLFLCGLERQRKVDFLFSLLLFFISYYFYHTPRVFVPLLIFGVTILYWQKLETQKTKNTSLIFLIICLVVSFLTIALGPGTARFKQVSIFNNPGVQLRLDEQIREEFRGTNIYLVRLFHNKLVNYGREILSNYTKHFAFDFLFLNGGLPMRYRIPEMGLLHLVEVPFLLLGIILLLKERMNLSWLMIYWLLIGPVAVSLTQEDVPNVQRSLFMLPSFQVITAYGFYKSVTFLKRKNWRMVLIIFSILGLGFNFSYFCHQYLVHQRVYRPWFRNYGLKELVNEINRVDSQYERIVFTKAHNDPYIYILFYNQYDPETYQRYHSLRSSDRWGFEKYVFHPTDCPSHQKEEIFRDGKALFVDKGECKAMPYTQTLKIISREDNTPVFRLLEVNKYEAEVYFRQQEKLILKNGEEK